MIDDSNVKTGSAPGGTGTSSGVVGPVITPTPPANQVIYGPPQSGGTGGGTSSGGGQVGPAITPTPPANQVIYGPPQSGATGGGTGNGGGQVGPAITPEPQQVLYGPPQSGATGGGTGNGGEQVGPAITPTPQQVLYGPPQSGGTGGYSSSNPSLSSAMELKDNVEKLMTSSENNSSYGNLAKSNAEAISGLFSSIEGNLSSSWAGIAEVTVSISAKLNEVLGDLHTELNTYIEKTLENEAKAQEAATTANNESQDVLSKLGSI